MSSFKYVNVEQLVPYARNARTHSDEQISQIAGSIVEFGWTYPVLADERGIIAGHGRVLAASRLYQSGKTLRMLGGGEEIPHGTVPVIDAHGWSDAQRRAYILADNRIAENAGWDMDMLSLEIQELQSTDFDIALLGFDDEFLGEILSENREIKPQDEMPKLPDGDREPFRLATFTLHDDQFEVLERAIRVSKSLGPFVDSANQNSNGNALSRICEIFLTSHNVG